MYTLKDSHKLDQFFASVPLPGSRSIKLPKSCTIKINRQYVDDRLRLLKINAGSHYGANWYDELVNVKAILEQKTGNKAAPPTLLGALRCLCANLNIIPVFSSTKNLVISFLTSFFSTFFPVFVPSYCPPCIGIGNCQPVVCYMHRPHPTVHSHAGLRQL